MGRSPRRRPCSWRRELPKRCDRWYIHFRATEGSHLLLSEGAAFSFWGQHKARGNNGSPIRSGQICDVFPTSQEDPTKASKSAELPSRASVPRTVSGFISAIPSLFFDFRSCQKHPSGGNEILDKVWEMWKGTHSTRGQDTIVKAVRFFSLIRVIRGSVFPPT